MRVITKTASLKTQFLMIETLAHLCEVHHSLEEALELTDSIFPSSKLNLVKSRLEEGEEIEEAIKEWIEDAFFLEFFHFYCQTSTIDQALLKTLSLCKQKQLLTDTLIKAMIYPAILLIGLLCFSFVAVFYLQPQFNHFFESFDIQFSLVQKLGLQCLFLIPAIVLIVIIAGLKKGVDLYRMLINQNIHLVEKTNQKKIYNNVIHKYYSIKFCLYYKEFVRLGYDFHTIMMIMKEKAGDDGLRMITFELLEKIQTGEDITQIVLAFPYFDDYFKTVFQLALSFNDPYRILDQYYTTSLLLIETWIKRAIAFITPCVYGFAGIYMVGIYAGMVMPMMRMIDHI